MKTFGIGDIVTFLISSGGTVGIGEILRHDPEFEEHHCFIVRWSDGKEYSHPSNKLKLIKRAALTCKSIW